MSDNLDAGRRRSAAIGARNREAVRAVYESGVTSPSAIARRVGLSERVALRHLAKLRGPREWARNRIPQEALDRARELLEDRAGYAEAARTVGVAADALRRNLPGYALSQAEKVERAVMGRKMRKLEGGSHAERIRYV